MLPIPLLSDFLKEAACQCKIFLYIFFKANHIHVHIAANQASVKDLPKGERKEKLLGYTLLVMLRQPYRRSKCRAFFLISIKTNLMFFLSTSHKLTELWVGLLFLNAVITSLSQRRARFILQRQISCLKKGESDRPKRLPFWFRFGVEQIRFWFGVSFRN